MSIPPIPTLAVRARRLDRQLLADDRHERRSQAPTANAVARALQLPARRLPVRRRIHLRRWLHEQRRRRRCPCPDDEPSPQPNRSRASWRPALPFRPRWPGGASAVRAAASRAPARVARTISLNESGQPAPRPANTASRSTSRAPRRARSAGTIYVHLTIVSTSRVTAEVNIYPSGGSISGLGTASYHRGRRHGQLLGLDVDQRGSGSYAHAHGSGLSFSGTIQRSNDADHRARERHGQLTARS